MNGTRIGWPLRTWFVVELFFAVSATISVALAPAQTSANFAWTIKPEVMAALFGAFYAALAPVLVLLIFARRWEMVRVFVLPGMLFTAAQLIVTLLHWDRFAVGTAPFNIWFASYLLPPPVFLACYVWQQRRADASGQVNQVDHDRPLATWQRRALIALGALFTLEAMVALVWPAWFFLLLGLLLLSMARENDRERVRIVSPFLILLLPVVAVQVGRFPEQVDWSHPRIAVSVLLLAAVAALGASLFGGGWRRTMK
jgi:hypothetical protein